MGNIFAEKGEYGLKAILRNPLSMDEAMQCIKQGIVEIEINYAKGWQGGHLDFLKYFPELRALHLFDVNVDAIEPIHSLNKLRYLKVLQGDNQTIQFSCFPLLEKCAMKWRPKSESLFNCVEIKDLFIDKFKSSDLSLFANLKKLERLALFNSNSIVKLDFLSQLGELRTLRLARLRKLVSVIGIASCEKLEAVDLDSCAGFRSLEPLRGLTHLRKIFLENLGPVESLAPIAKLPRLEWLTFCGTTNILDGNVSVLTENKTLVELGFGDRRHYNYRNSQFQSPQSI
jgi:hypothetical protein